ncbi:DUF2236 domain-containing protein [Actinocrinis puniceicyclus]|uniref:DUF2236 domain-containing protein n=1 Tax=Actinocrinis puniceicyclus TaxID=977794 RepID=A0A8J8BHE9_9ACTN|nr:oxygenase MpaB family protein [Actinocrinis puniceicyclus]MBS2966714.1 DUF2236 domain-containing protein [Actinocrinis puniceicyclus]
MNVSPHEHDHAHQPSPAGPDAADPQDAQRPDDAADPGLFGPDSVSWRVMADPAFAFGGLRALFLQALYPRAMAGLAQNSDLSAPPWSRLLRTARYVHTVTYGTSEQAQQAAARVRAIHRALWGRDPDNGRPFRLDDPQALLWVHVAMAESFLSTARRAGLSLSADETDRFYREQVLAAQLVGLDPAAVPATAAQVARYFEQIRPQLRLTPQAAQAARLLLWPPMNAKARLYGARAGWLALSSTAFGLLPRWARRLYRLPALPGADLPPVATARLLRTAAATLPTPLRRGSPMLQEARARTGAVAADRAATGDQRSAPLVRGASPARPPKPLPNPGAGRGRTAASTA